ncbi:probable Zinc-regulated transporter 1 [Zygosaccharomyces bailii]|nr:probable Zinc-regulated transporter 1 [Zygosaccharomyces bailii]
MAQVKPWWEKWDPNKVTLADQSVDDSWKYCVLQGVFWGEPENNKVTGARISSIFVIFGVSTLCTLFPVVAQRVSWLRVNKYVYQFARSFGTGVIISTAYIHLLDPAYQEIGGFSCIAQTGNWAIYSWCPAIMLTTVFATFLVDLFSAFYVERKYGVVHEEHGDEIADAIIGNAAAHDHGHGKSSTVEHARDADEEEALEMGSMVRVGPDDKTDKNSLTHTESYTVSETDSVEVEMSFRADFGAFLVLEAGLLFHSVMIGLNLGTVGKEFSTLYPVLVFHQSFEGLGIGARLCAIEFPRKKRWWPYALCVAYGITTPICVAIGLGVRSTYSSNSYSVNIVSGVLDSISAGVLMYTGMVELLARDYLFNPNRTKDLRELLFNLFSMLVGAGLMALLGKWA